MNRVSRWIIGILLLVVIGGSFVGGAIAERLFVIKPLDYLVPRGQGGTSSEATRLVLQEESAVIDVAGKVAPSVVTVSIKQERVAEPFFIDPFGLFGPRGSDRGRAETIEQDIGSGFVVEGGLVVTNKHVVSQVGAEYKIVDRDDGEHAVINIYRDPVNDLAILQIEGELPPVELGDSDALRVGQSVVAIGTALGEFRHTVTTGVVSGLGRGITAGDGLGGVAEQLENVIQTDAAINPGNSGGPLLNSAGQVIGINTAISTAAENIGFAIPINVLKESLTHFEETGRFDRAFLGVQYSLISQEAALLNEVPQGALIRAVVPGSAAEEAGIAVGDIITRIDGQTLTDDDESVAEIIGSKKIGDTIDVELWRDGNTETVKVVLKGGQ